MKHLANTVRARCAQIAIGIVFAAAIPAFSAVGAQGRLIIMPCPAPPCPRGVACAEPAVRCGTVGVPSVERVSTSVRVTLVQRVLHYEVIETFENRGGTIGEADYVFPLPPNAAFEDVRLEINGELVAGEIMDATHARAEYERIVREQRDPALVEWMGAGMLRARIFPFGARQKRTVAVRYQQVAPREGDALRVEFRRPDANGSTARNSIQLELPAEEYGEPYSPTHDVTVKRSGSKRVAEVRGNASDVVVLIPVPKSNAASIGVLTHAAGPRDKFALITIAPPTQEIVQAPRDLTFVLDVSGSMEGGKLAQAKAAGRQLLNTLSPSDRFRMVDFATDVHTFRDEFVPATPKNIAAAQEYLSELRAVGSTNISGALADALRAAAKEPRERMSLVLFVTDGEPTVGIRNADAIADSVQSWRGRVRVFSFGLGSDVNASLVEQIAMQGHGVSHFIRPDESVERMVGIVAQRLQRPLVTDLRLEGEGVRLVQQYPSQPADLYAGQELVVLARYEGNGAGAIRVIGQGAGGAISWRTSAQFPDRSDANDFVPRLWATQRIGWLSAERRRQGASAELDDELRSLGVRYGIPTELTSYMVREPRVAAAPPSQGIERLASPATSGVRGTSGVKVQNREVAADIAFEQAKAASAQRSATSIAVVDSLVSEAERRDDTKSASRRRAMNRPFELRDGVWTDASLLKDELAGGTVRGKWTLHVQAYSPAWFAALRAIPALKEAFSLGDRVRIAGRSVTLEVDAIGEKTLDDATLARLVSAWQ